MYIYYVYKVWDFFSQAVVAAAATISAEGVEFCITLYTTALYRYRLDTQTPSASMLIIIIVSIIYFFYCYNGYFFQFSTRRRRLQIKYIRRLPIVLCEFFNDLFLRCLYASLYLCLPRPPCQGPY